MTEYKITFSIERTEYSTATKVIEAESLEEAKRKAQELADDDDDNFFDEIDDEDPGDSYADITVNDVEEYTGEDDDEDEENEDEEEDED